MDDNPPPPPVGPEGLPTADYYRPGGPASAYGSADRLQALMEGYFGLSIAFGVNVALSLCSRAAGMAVDPGIAVAITVIVLILFIAIMGFMVHPQNKKIGSALDWPDSKVLTATILMALNGLLCCGIIGFAIMQNFAVKEMYKYGIKGGTFFGVKKKDIQATIDAMRANPRPF